MGVKISMESGEQVKWADGPNKTALARDFGIGPFKGLGVEAAEEGQWVSLLNAEGLAWVSHRSAWESPNADTPGLYKAIPPTFHSSWLEVVT